jgi:GNAT superfamily N-acetyltransferase
MDLDIKPASDYPMPDLLNYLNLGFESYLVPVNFNITQFLTMLRKDSVDLTSSRVLLVDDRPSGVALIARRGWNSRLAAMGIEKESRGKGLGTWFMDQLIQDARERDDHEMMLEVIEQNEAAVRLYKKHGFQIIRRLIGLVNKDVQQEPKIELEEIDLREMGRLILQYGLPDLPWQLSGESVAVLHPPACAYKNGQAYIAISDPDTNDVVIHSLLVEPDARGNGLAVELLKHVLAKHTGRTWHVPAIWPEELGVIFERAGFQRESLSQWQMRLRLIETESAVG